MVRGVTSDRSEEFPYSSSIVDSREPVNSVNPVKPVPRSVVIGSGSRLCGTHVLGQTITRGSFLRTLSFYGWSPLRPGHGRTLPIGSKVSRLQTSLLGNLYVQIKLAYLIAPPMSTVSTNQTNILRIRDPTRECKDHVHHLCQGRRG